MNRRFNSPPDPAAIQQLLQGGLPDGPLAIPNRYFQANAAGKLHAESGCGRLRSSYNMVAQVDVRTMPSARYCSVCVDGLTSPTSKAYLTHAQRVLDVGLSLVKLRARLITDRGEALGDDALLELAGDMSVVLELGRVTWERVSQGEVLVRHLQSIRDDEHVSPEMLEWMAPVERLVRDQHTRLRSAARAATDDGQLVRLCVLDLMGTHGFSTAGKNTPDDTDAPGDPKLYPALCVSGSDYGDRFTIHGFKDLVSDAWKTWRAEMRATDNPEAARDAVLTRTQIDTLEPRHSAQFHRGPARVPAPAGGVLWDWLVAEWRHQATTELHAVLDFWEVTYQEALAKARKQSPKVVALQSWTLQERTNVNASTNVLSQLAVVYEPRHDSALVIAPGVVADWLCVYDVSGKFVAKTQAHTKTVSVVCDASATDDEEMLATAMRLWVPRKANQRLADLQFTKLLTAVTAAQGIHAAA